MVQACKRLWIISGSTSATVAKLTRPLFVDSFGKHMNLVLLNQFSDVQLHGVLKIMMLCCKGSPVV